MPIVARGGTITLNALVNSGGLADSADLSLTVQAPGGATLAGFPVVQPAIIHDGTGLYHYVWSVSALLDPGTYHAAWGGTVNGLAITGGEDVEVVATGTIITQAIDSTLAGLAANSYLSVAEANAMAANDLGRFATQWLTATVERKERALIQATLDVDGFVGATIPYTVGQSLRFPRLIDVSGVLPYVPTEIRRATYEQAVFLQANSDALDDAAARRARGMFSWSDQDGGGTLAIDPRTGRMAPDAEAHLDSFSGRRRRSSRTIVSVPITPAWRS